MRRLLTALIAVAAVAGCTGTFTPPLPTLYLVFLEADGGEPARVALLDFVVTASERRLDLLTAQAYRFDAGETLIAIDVMDRVERQEAWVLTAAGAASRALTLHRLDLRSLPDVPGTALTPAAPPLALTDADGAWIGFDAATGVPTGCLSGLVVAPAGDAVALWDAGAGARCGAVADAPDPRVHLLDVAAGTVGAPIAEARAPGVRPGDPELGRGDRLLLVRRPTAVDPDTVRVAEFGFADAVPPALAEGTLVERFLDLAGVPGGFAALRRVDGGGREVVVHLRTGDEPAVRAMPDDATALFVDDSGALSTLLTTGGGRIGVTYPDEAEPREISFAASDLTIDPLNAYALAVRPGGVCVVDLLVPSRSAGCDLAIDAAVREALAGARFVTWTFAEPSGP
ncbi:MAG: hypothetical protein K0A98_00420 [Trueperaceae bacterium]|nr:hypothetical protein [Trueperaceae bacterium]